MQTNPAVTVETLQALLGAFNRHDLDAVMEFFSDDPVLEMPRGSWPWGTRAKGRDDVRRLLGTRFAGIPDAHWGQDGHFVCGNRGVSEWTLSGTAGEEKIEVRGCDLFEFANGRICRKDSYWKIVE
ncbi:MAG: nuclear transport factor 2 family protein [Candidatus Dormibacteraeota bacterium]|uniref:Nuclear transport factor 2 family protein n=1 Tax=Candidatus Aeolococcus gillhamiae TaxID=3127015 RepID=A0A934K045_9BACT|nr:nuclear transport factor 2 family protein [Candidatus Dormibacteraeota bacterium]